MSNHITFDLETLGNTSKAPIIQIGAVRFRPEKTGVYIMDTFKVNVKWESLKNYNFECDYSTIKWWLQQSQEAQKSILDETNSVNIKKALILFKEWINFPNEHHFWSHSTFDPPILHNACKLVGIDSIIPYRNNRDIRTLNFLAGDVRLEREGIAHDALNDAIYQANYISMMLQQIRNE